MALPLPASPRHASSKALGLFGSLLLILLLAGCREDVTAVVGSERAFTLYGVLTPERDTQTVRVFPIEDRLTPTQAGSLEVRITSKDLATDQVRVWQDSLLREPTGRNAHAFWAPFKAEYGHTYQITAEGVDGSTSRVQTTVPFRAELEVRPPRFTFTNVLLPVLVSGDVPQLNKVEITYHIKFNVGPPEQTTLRAKNIFEGQPSRVEEGLLLQINLSDVYASLRTHLQRGGLWEPAYGISLLKITLKLIVASADWNPPEGGFDPEVLIQPGTMSNVENGFGFVGAGYRLEETWTPPDSALEKVGFTLLGQ